MKKKNKDLKRSAHLYPYCTCESGLFPVFQKLFAK